MLGLILALLGLGGVALLARSNTAATVAAAAPPAPVLEFTEVIEHSPEFKARQAAQARRASVPRNVLFIGDSLTASGYFKKITLPGALLKGKGWPGRSVASILDNAGPLLTETKPTDVVLLAGVNDLASGRSAAQVEAALSKAWQALRLREARVWAVKLTPWYGYKAFKDPARAATLRAATEAVNAYMVAKRGAPDGPDEVIDTKALGDAAGKLPASVSHDGLHLNGKGYAKLAQIVQDALAAAPAAEVGADPIAPALRRAIDAALEPLRRQGIGPTDFELDWDVVTLVYRDALDEKVAAGMVPDPILHDGRRYRFTTRTARAVAVGGAAPEAVQRVIDSILEHLKRNGAEPATWRYTEVRGERLVTFGYYTPFRRDRAYELTSPTYAAGATGLRVKHEVITDSTVGQVVGTDQSTPWTCGPAALRAVLAHHGDDIDEDTVAVLAGNVPVLGVRPSGLVKAARELGYHVNAFQAGGPAALAPFLARDMPVLCVVDSFTQPGRAGHWVVVTAVGPDRVTLMDPHTPGNWRTLTPAAFDARWWHREGGKIARRLAVVVVPQAFVEVGAAADVTATPPAHGRTATMKYKGSWVGTLTSVARKITRAAVEAFGGKAVATSLDAVQDAVVKETKGLSGKDFAAWLNTASNEEVAALWLGELRRALKQAHDKKIKKALAVFGRLGADDSTLTVDPIRALTTALRVGLASYDNPLAKLVLEPFFTTTKLAHVTVPADAQLVKLQALAILLYGGADVLPLLDELLKARPKVKHPSKDPEFAALIAWADDALATLAKTVEPAEPERDFA